MKNGKLTAISLERFKSFEKLPRLELAPLTIVLGRNNSGKSTLIQALLLLKQTLAEVRQDVPILLSGPLVDSFNLRELTYGWGGTNGSVTGPSIEVEWECEVDIDLALKKAKNPNRDNLSKHTVSWLKNARGKQNVLTSLRIDTEEVAGNAQISKITLKALKPELLTLVVRWGKNVSVTWKNKKAEKLSVEFDHFIPYFTIPTDLGPRDKNRAYRNGFLVLFAQPLLALKSILGDLQYLGSAREQPPSLFKVATTVPNEVGISGEFAAELLQRRQEDIVHFTPPLKIEAPTLPSEVRAAPLGEAMNETLAALGIGTPVKIEGIGDYVFRVLFGKAPLSQVGRGLGYLLPLIELGLIADPIRFQGHAGSVSITEYTNLCSGFTHIALEEPESHLHPKIASQLAHWLVSLAAANRRFIVETHSDHLVRRLRGLVARAGEGSDLESWLLKNVVLLSVEQGIDGRSIVTTSHLTAGGGVGEVWPADFMDEASNEESEIFYARMNKNNTNNYTLKNSQLEWNDGDEPDGEESP